MKNKNQKVNKSSLIINQIQILKIRQIRLKERKIWIMWTKKIKR